MDGQIPEELLFQILIRLPVLALFRFRCVSRAWYTLISSFEFIDGHLHFNDNNNSYFNVLFKKIIPYPVKEICCLHADDEQLEEIGTYEYPFPNISMLGSCKGLICLMKLDTSSIILWNPIIRKYFTLPKYVQQSTIIDGDSISSSSNSSSEASVAFLQLFDMCFGFGYDFVSKDFKVVKIVGYGGKKFYDSDKYSSKTHVSVFSLSTKTWKTLPFCAPIMSPYSRSCNVSGFVYRLSSLKSDYCDDKVMCFDLNTEVFTEIALPIDDPTNPPQSFRPELTVFRDSLGMLHNWNCKDCDLWVLKEDGAVKWWMKLFSIHFDGGTSLGHDILGFTKKGIMLVTGDGQVLVSPAAAEEDAEALEYPPPPATRFGCEYGWLVDNFKESLILLNDGVSSVFQPY